MIIIIPITKDEAQRLNKEYNVQFGSYGISTTHTRHKRYFLTENKINLDAISEIREVIPFKKNKLKNKRVGV